MSKELAFWDASGIVPLCVHESASRHAQAQLRHFMPVVWWASSVEVRSAIARLHRLGTLKEADKTGAVSRLNLLSRAWREILPSDSVCQVASDLLDSNELRAADSLQLAAALIWCQERTARRRFICADQRLSKSAASVGFSVVELT